MGSGANHPEPEIDGDFALGALVRGGVTCFRTWAPRARSLCVKLLNSFPDSFELTCGPGGVWEAWVEKAPHGTDYVFVQDGASERNDPASRWQPLGVHGPSRVFDPARFNWSDSGWQGIDLERYVLYELHVGTFSRKGTFAGTLPHLSHLKDLGVTALALMPVGEFPGERNWGYDGAYLFAPQSTYGGPCELQRLVDACHQAGIAVVLDAVYNHLGPEGCTLNDFAPYLTPNHQTPWGHGLNFDGPDALGVRRHVIANALYWLTEFHIDALRLDGVHALVDRSELHLLEELGTAVRRRGLALGRRTFLIGEPEYNDVQLTAPPSEGGRGLDAVWSPDFHHALRSLLTQDRRGELADFGRMEDLGVAVTRGAGRQHVIFLENHDQVATASHGDRLSTILTFDQSAMAAALLYVAPQLTMLFMGQEYGEPAPFFYFTSHSEPTLIEAVREGRKRELRSFGSTGSFPDPQSPETFDASRLDWSLCRQTPHRELLALYRRVGALRSRRPCLNNCRADLTRVSWSEEEQWLVVHRCDPSGDSAVAFFNFASVPRPIAVEAPPIRYRLELDTRDMGQTLPQVLEGPQLYVTCLPVSAVIYVKSEPPP